MPAITATAPGKIILFGEHAVVYDRPAIAIPVDQVRARAVISPNPLAESGQVLIQAPDIALEADLRNLPDDDPLVKAIWSVVHELRAYRIPACIIRVSSSIPLASGMGSGAAVSVAVIRAMSSFLGKPLPNDIVSELAYEVERIHHGTPSGIDNTVITYNTPVYFQRGEPFKILKLAKSFTIIIANSGMRTPTAVTVGQVRKDWLENREEIEMIFNSIEQTTIAARQSLENGMLMELGSLMNENQRLLQTLRVSSVELDHLVQAARQAGALGAKLSGGGGGGNMIALVEPQTTQRVAETLLSQGATGVLTTHVPGLSG
jgi:mevalonate kinase